MRKTVAGLLGAVLVASVGLVQVKGQAAAPWNLVAHEIATGLRGGYHVTATDINKDGRVDLLAVATGAKVDLVWYENPSWTPHVMASGFPGMINADAFDPIDAMDLGSRAVRVLELLADGRTTREIADDLSYSERTIKKHIHDLERRLGARSRAQVVAQAIRQGVI